MISEKDNFHSECHIHLGPCTWTKTWNLYIHYPLSPAWSEYSMVKKKKVNPVCIQREKDLSLSLSLSRWFWCWGFPYINRLSKILPAISDICIIRVYNDLTLFLLQNILISWVFLWFNNNKRILVFRIDSNWIHEMKVAMWRI